MPQSKILTLRNSKIGREGFDYGLHIFREESTIGAWESLKMGISILLIEQLL